MRCHLGPKSEVRNPEFVETQILSEHPRGGPLTMSVTELVIEYVEEIEKSSVLHSPGQTNRLIWRFKRFMDDYGDRDPATLTPEEITNWLKPMSGLTHRSQLVALFRHATQRGYLDANPAYSAPEQRPRTAFLTTRQIL
jgi:hypothetical protein